MADDINGSRNPTRPHQPIFVLGILPRCGTNYLLDLLCVHPDCASSSKVREDYLLYHVDLLFQYVNAVYDHWTPGWGADDALRDRLYAHLGSGLVSFLTEVTDAGRVVTKTPRVENLGMFFKLFPDARLVILVRDGRAVLESGIKTFRWNRESAMHRWARAARTILEFDEANKNSSLPYLIVRYEDLWQDLEEELRRILDFLGLDPTLYDFQAARRLPVKGSSTIRAPDDEHMHWKPVEKTPEFDPMSRFRHWGRARHERFRWVAGRYLEHFGYVEIRFTTHRWVWSLWNVILDIRWAIVRTLGPIYLKWKRPRRVRRPLDTEAG
jgi:hypothetical protein